MKMKMEERSQAGSVHLKETARGFSISNIIADVSDLRSLQEGRGIGSSGPIT